MLFLAQPSPPWSFSGLPHMHKFIYKLSLRPQEEAMLALFTLPFCMLSVCFHQSQTLFYRRRTAHNRQSSRLCLTTRARPNKVMPTCFAVRLSFPATAMIIIVLYSLSLPQKDRLSRPFPTGSSQVKHALCLSPNSQFSKSF